MAETIKVLTKEAATAAGAQIAKDYAGVSESMAALGFKWQLNGQSISTEDMRKDLADLVKVWGGYMFVADTQFGVKVFDGFAGLMSAIQAKERQGTQNLTTILTALASNTPEALPIMMLAIAASQCHTRSNLGTVRLKGFGIKTADPVLHLTSFVLEILSNLGREHPVGCLYPVGTGTDETQVKLWDRLTPMVPGTYNGMNFAINGKLFFYSFCQTGPFKKIFQDAKEFQVKGNSAFGVCLHAVPSFGYTDAMYLVDYAEYVTTVKGDTSGFGKTLAFVVQFIREMIAKRNNVEETGAFLQFGIYRVHLKRFLKMMRENEACHSAILNCSSRELDKALNFADENGVARYTDLPGVVENGMTEAIWQGLELSHGPDGKEVKCVNQATIQGQGKGDKSALESASITYTYGDFAQKALGTKAKSETIPTSDQYERLTLKARNLGLGADIGLTIQPGKMPEGEEDRKKFVDYIQAYDGGASQAAAKASVVGEATGAAGGSAVAGFS